MSILHALFLTLGLIQVTSPFLVSYASVIPTDAKELSALPFQVPSSPQVRDILSARSSNSSTPYQNRADSGNDCHVKPYDAPLVGQQDFPPFDEDRATVFRYRQQQSVNLGSWFVHENWMTPSVFRCASGKQSAEIDIATGWGSVSNARALLERHWDTFITEDDFQYLASIGINTVRLPIGYWNLGPDFCKGTPFAKVAAVYENSWPRIVRAINMANDAGIGVLVDLHGAVGSQNGQAHSGVSDGATRLFDDPRNVEKTMNVLKFLTRQLASVTNVVGIQILNEPKYVDGLEDFYTQAITTMRAVSEDAKNLPLYLHDGFNLNRFSKYVASRKDFVVQDHHSYFVFGKNDKSASASQHTSDVKSKVSGSLATTSNKQRRNLVVDEWSCALTPASSQQENNPAQAQKKFCSTQLATYSGTAAGWSFWAYMKEGCDSDAGWCFKSAVGKNLPDTFFSYGDSAPALASTKASTSTNPSPSKARSSKRRGPRSRRHIAIVRRAKTNSEGYNDGFQAAKTFAAVGMSKLGFSGQFIQDQLTKSDSSVDSDAYSNDFMKGLTDGEASVASGQS